MTLRRPEDVFRSRFHPSRKTVNRVHSKSRKIRKGPRPIVDSKLIPRDSTGVEFVDELDTDFDKLIEEFIGQGPDHMGSDWLDFHLQESSRRDREINQRFQVVKRLAPYPLLQTSIEEEDDVPDSLSIDNHELILYDLDPIAEKDETFDSWLPSLN